MHKHGYLRQHLHNVRVFPQAATHLVQSAEGRHSSVIQHNDVIQQREKSPHSLRYHDDSPFSGSLHLFEDLNEIDHEGGSRPTTGSSKTRPRARWPICRRSPPFVFRRRQ